MVRKNAPADPDKVGEFLAAVLLPRERRDIAGMDDLPDPMIDLDAALEALRRQF